MDATDYLDFEHYGVIAKKIERKDELRKKGFLVYDLDDWK